MKKFQFRSSEKTIVTISSELRQIHQNTLKPTNPFSLEKLLGMERTAGFNLPNYLVTSVKLR